ncbi:MAG TPA: hypothetical protein VFZ65_13900 [Planctomycetota bacterium]|nr:hypothetical protein [Planctomycetota bacterium]
MEWLKVLTGVCAASVTAVLMAWMASASYRGVAFVGDAVLLAYSKVQRTVLAVAWLLCVAGCVALLWPIVGGAPTAEELRRAAVAGPLAIVFGVVTFAEGRVRLVMDGVGLRGRTAFRGLRQVAWAEVVEVRYSFLGHWFLVRDRAGEKLRVPCFLHGMNAFITALRAKLPQQRVAKAIAGYKKRVGIE